MHSDGIRNDLEPQKKENKDGKGCIRTVFETIWNRRKKKKKDGKWCILTVYETL